MDRSFRWHCLSSVNSNRLFLVSYLRTEGNTPFLCLRKLFPTLLSHPNPVTWDFWGENHKLADRKKKDLLKKHSPAWTAMLSYHISPVMISFLFLYGDFRCMLHWLLHDQETRSELEVHLRDVAGSQTTTEPWQIVHLRCVWKHCTFICHLQSVLQCIDPLTRVGHKCIPLTLTTCVIC